jgi:Arc-like DNA binding domain
MQRTVAKRAERPRGRSPVIAGRVPSSLHRKIKQAAKASGRSMSEELAFRAEQSFQREAFEPLFMREVSALQSQLQAVNKKMLMVNKKMLITWIKERQRAQKVNEEALSRIVEAAVARALAHREELP